MDADLRALGRLAMGRSPDPEAIRDFCAAALRVGARPACPCACHKPPGAWFRGEDRVPEKDRRLLTASRLRAAGLECIPVNSRYFGDFVSWPETVCERRLDDERFGSVGEAVAALSAAKWPRFVLEPPDQEVFDQLVKNRDLNERWRLDAAVHGKPPFIAIQSCGPHPSVDQTWWLGHLATERVHLADALVSARAGAEAEPDGLRCPDCVGHHFAFVTAVLASSFGEAEVRTSMSLLSDDIETRVQTKAALHRDGVDVLG